MTDSPMLRRRDLMGLGAAAALHAAYPAWAQATTVTHSMPSSAQALAQRLGTGWNLGNALEAIGGETAWGNPKASQALMDAVKAAGFGCIRIPVAWKQYADAQDRIRADWLARVAEVVGMARRAGLYVLINVHWDGGWLQPTLAAQPTANARLASYWTQIASHFRAYEEGLLFAGTNEVMVDGDWGPPKPEYVQVQNGFNQLFVDTVRATGGANAQRVLVVQGFNTDIQHTLQHAVVPRDSASGRLMMEVHYYDPYDFTLNEKSKTWQWGAQATDRKLTAGWGDEAHADAMFAKMKARFIDQGVPVILGEYGVIRREEYPGAEVYRQAWLRHVSQSARRHGLVPIYWDAGAPRQNHSMGLFDRQTGELVHPALLRALMSTD